MKGKDIFLTAAMLVISLLVDAAVVLLLFVSGLVSPIPVLFYNIPLAVLFIILALLVLNVQLLLIPVLMKRFVAPTVLRFVSATVLYFAAQFVLTLASGFILPVVYLIVSLALLALYVFAVELVYLVSGLAQTWGKNKPEGEG